MPLAVAALDGPRHASFPQDAGRLAATGGAGAWSAGGGSVAGVLAGGEGVGRGLLALRGRISVEARGSPAVQAGFQFDPPPALQAPAPPVSAARPAGEDRPRAGANDRRRQKPTVMSQEVV